jgi:hypothetical protein
LSGVRQELLLPVDRTPAGSVSLSRGAARSGANLTGLDGEDTWLSVSANAAPAPPRRRLPGAERPERQPWRDGRGGGASFFNVGAVGDTSRNGRNNNGVNAAGSANGGSGASTPLSLGDVAAFIGTAGVEGAGGNAGTGGGSGGAARMGGGSITASTMGGRGGQPGGGGSGALTPAAALAATGNGRVRRRCAMAETRLNMHSKTHDPHDPLWTCRPLTSGRRSGHPHSFDRGGIAAIRRIAVAGRQIRPREATL